jgi:methionine synthase II (cobalamin-independent)
VKGMMNGRIALLASSFVRGGQTLSDTAGQVPLTLRYEIANLKAVGNPIIQVHEPSR